MPEEPILKGTIAFFDGQNLFHNAKAAFGYSYPNYNPVALASRICSDYNWSLVETRFYTGLPSQAKDPSWYHFWEMKLAEMGRYGVKSYTRPIRYRTEKIKFPDGTATNVVTRQEKGIDIRLALEIVRFALDNKYDVALVFSQDQDLSEVSDEVKATSKLQNRWIQMTRRTRNTCVSYQVSVPLSILQLPLERNTRRQSSISFFASFSGFTMRSDCLNFMIFAQRSF